MRGPLLELNLKIQFLRIFLSSDTNLQYKSYLAPEWDKVWSRLSAHFQPFFQLLLALSLSISGSLWLSVTPILALTGSLRLLLVLSGSL